METQVHQITFNLPDPSDDATDSQAVKQHIIKHPRYILKPHEGKMCLLVIVAIWILAYLFWIAITVPLSLDKHIQYFAQNSLQIHDKQGSDVVVIAVIFCFIVEYTWYILYNKTKKELDFVHQYTNNYQLWLYFICFTINRFLWLHTSQFHPSQRVSEVGY